MKDINLNIVLAMVRTYNGLISKIEKNVQENGLNLSEFGVLEFIYNQGPQPVQKIADKILVTSGTITYVINKLESKNLVIRKKCEKDKRIFYVSLTKEGEELILKVFKKHKEFLNDLLSEMDEESKRSLLTNLIKMRKILK
ncbi:MarR family winged helix-turn-helix transcriptional regulator [Caproiciproducens sp. MSJ-32]|uniref:MarR family winged helix-turn-helix transcriptional regulator n=1 Tax=Caproiciproducens sp. MSJ-32 TaxID=2841527 RepID=UPI001C10D028|nr:MarR family transcriptional regulator [Caproiciproducens sp. MSJ-32]MBU5454466.1 MarR family transcriptional regulator [Caproiciproducens sp. MSJ-32]